MNGVHDMGGMDGFGPVAAETGEPVFHARWEGRVFAMVRAMGYTGLWTLDETRATQERLPPAKYLSVSYYERWMLGLRRMLMSRDLVSKEEIAGGRAQSPGKSLPRKLTRDKVPAALARPSFSRAPQAPPRFAVGDLVRTRNMHPKGATRLPRYARDCCGSVARVQGCHVFPDSVVAGKGDDPQWLYTVLFDGRELWGPDSDPTVRISIDAFEPYLQPASPPPVTAASLAEQTAVG